MDLLIGPPAKPQYNHAIQDFCTPEGAAELKRRCEQFWDRREKFGVPVKFWIEAIADRRWERHGTGRLFFCVRSNLVRGLPP